MTTKFRTQFAKALAQHEVRNNTESVVNKLRKHRLAAFPDQAEWISMRRHSTAIRANATSKLPQLLEQLETNLQRNGIQVHWADTTEQANQTVLNIMRFHDARFIIKGKSMVSEEMGLNDFLNTHGIECLESDLGELIIQLAAEKPSHMIVPALHKNRKQIARLFHSQFPSIPYTEDISALAQAARRFLRHHFATAPVGLTGVNFMIAETGTLCLVENEGNGRMCSTAPPVHIAVSGIEKVVECLDDVPPLLGILTRSATGQPITTYVNMISSPRKPNEKDGPTAVHLILLDNGRSRIYSDPELRDTLNCIRCGACMNHCPIYKHIGGHAYQTVIPGPIGTILEPQKNGLDSYGELTQASTLCGACQEVCPVSIPIPKIINRLRWEHIRKSSCSTPGAGSGRRKTEAIIWKIWAWNCIHPGAYNRITSVATSMRRLADRILAKISPWTAARAVPRLPDTTLHERLKALKIDNE
ncbi:LutB/LldF family L-lactate oxidation iron-sulfur protein [Nitrosomonas marina]|uniref:L-lactate dehydrogenase complex protein LldF n=1 Tax=Nitrosomonas marina TaxID=917 RepID=A0A1H8EQH6_9PROT|nr:LutB/LldF family L-lactate oxidation iron-sulfur protein [Nitrosomonas marina]SEN21692.1 L-lactate dehydrogenase complex protein LldF [Nitrosomonas marina]